MNKIESGGQQLEIEENKMLIRYETQENKKEHESAVNKIVFSVVAVDCNTKISHNAESREGNNLDGVKPM